MSAISNALSSIGNALIHSSPARTQGKFVHGLLQSAIASGGISATDQTALSSAIDDIGSRLAAGTNPSTGSPATAPLTPSTAIDSRDPDMMTSKVDGLIDGEVTDGKLTSDQAGALKSLFAKAANHMAANGHHGGHAGASALASGNSAGDSTSGASGAASDPLSALSAFVTQLKSAAQSAALYGASGATGAGIASLLVNAAA